MNTNIKNVIQFQRNASQDFFELSFTNAAIPMALLEPDGKWLRVNRACCQFFNYTESELLKTEIRSLTHPDDVDSDATLIERLLSGEIETFDIQKRYCTKYGEVVWGLLTVSLVRNNDDSPKCFISQIQDITAQVALKQKNEDQLKELQELTMHIAHEFKSPLSSFGHLCGFIIKELEKDNVYKAIDLLRLGARTSQELLDLSGELLELGGLYTRKGEALKFVDVTSLIEHSKHRVAFLTNRERLQISVETHRLSEVQVDKYPLQLIFDNIISNAVRYLDKKKEWSFLNIVISQSDQHLIIQFEDNGIGLSDEQIKVLFDSHTTFQKGVKNASGVGLFILKQSLERLNGDIKVTKNEHGGITTGITVPLP